MDCNLSYKINPLHPKDFFGLFFITTAEKLNRTTFYPQYSLPPSLFLKDNFIETQIYVRSFPKLSAFYSPFSLNAFSLCSFFKKLPLCVCVCICIVFVHVSMLQCMCVVEVREHTCTHAHMPTHMHMPLYSFNFVFLLTF